MKNIVFSTTRQWNCGDEFILMGCINLMKKVIGENFNPIIYNRHPDLPHEFASDNSIFARCGLRFNDNSLKYYTEASFIDLVVLAGTPEWASPNCQPLYEMINRHYLPTVAIGIGSENTSNDPMIKETISGFKLFTVRDQTLVDKIRDCTALYMPCPSIVSVDVEKEKKITSVKKIALIYSGDINRSAEWNCVSTETYNYLMNLYKRLLNKYKEYEFSIICHYIDELPYATAEFPNINCIYSYDSKDYIDIYRQYDFVIGCRIHGIGICASIGIPAIGISHDFRGGTLDGFLAEIITIGTSYEDATELFEKSIATISDKNNKLLSYKNKIISEYINLLKDNIGDILALTDKSTTDRAPHLQNTDSTSLKDIISSYLDLNKIYKILMNSILKGRNVAIKGAGKHTEEVLKMLDPDIEIKCIISKEKLPENSHNIDIISNCEIGKYDVDTILISSYRYREEMIKEILQLQQDYFVLDIYRLIERMGIILKTGIV